MRRPEREDSGKRCACGRAVEPRGGSRVREMKPSWTPRQPPKCPRIAAQRLPRRPRRSRPPSAGDKIRRACVCPPMQLVHPGAIMCLLQEAPRQPSLTLITEETRCTAPIVPRVFTPLAPLSSMDLPRPETFGSTTPVPPVGRNGKDGGMPRSVAPGRATVVPPLLLPPESADRAATVAWTIVVPFPTPGPPKRVVVAACSSAIPAEVVEGSTSHFACPEMQGITALLAAALDLPCTCPRSDGQLVTKPYRVKLPTFVPAPRREEGNKRCGDGGGDEGLVGNLGVLGDAGNAPTLEWAAKVQDAMDDQQRTVPRLNFAQAAPPHVPRVPEPMPNGRAMVAVGSECPWLGARVSEAVSHAFEALDVRSPAAGVKAEPPPSIKREALKSRPNSIAEAAIDGETDRASYATCQNIVWRPKSATGASTVEYADRPVWRDEPNKAEACCLSPKPVWRDSEGVLEAFRDPVPNAPRTSPCLQEPCNLLSPTSTLRTRPSVPTSRSISPLGTLLRRKHAQYSRHVSEKLKGKRTPSVGPNQRTARTTLRSHNRRARKADWKDTVATLETTPRTPRKIDPIRLLAILLDSEMPGVESGHTTNGGGIMPVEPAIVKGSKSSARLGDVRIRSPSRGRTNKVSPRLPVRTPRRASKPIRVERGSTATFGDFLQITARCPDGPREGHGRNRLVRSGSFLSAATSSATAVWKSMTSTPDEIAPSYHCSNGRGSAHTFRESEKCIRADHKSGKASGERRAPAFEPWGVTKDTIVPSQKEWTDSYLERYSVPRRERDGEDEDTWSLPPLGRPRRKDRIAEGEDDKGFRMYRHPPERECYTQSGARDRGTMQEYVLDLDTGHCGEPQLVQRAHY